ncbi:MAG: VanZ family protein [Planctomycetaceae bacterium]|nr:VanZ family protein [Planctomycetaceae bacterium]
MLLLVSWSLLSPDPYAVVRRTSFSWIRTLDDAVKHAAAFAALAGVTASFCFRLLNSLPTCVIIGLTTYAAATEILQGFVPGRSCDPLDAVANSVGIVVGLLLATSAHSFFACKTAETASISG